MDAVDGDSEDAGVGGDAGDEAEGGDELGEEGDHGYCDVGIRWSGGVKKIGERVCELVEVAVMIV